MRYTPYVLLLLLAAALAAALAVYVWRRRGAAGTGEVAFMLAGVFAWCFGYAAEFASAGLGAKVFWAKVEYLGICTIPATWLVFALRYTGRETLLTRRNLFLLFFLPAVTIALVWTNEAHRLVWSRTYLDPSGAILLLDHGPAFWAYWIFSYLMLVLGTILLAARLLRSQLLYRQQGAAMLVAVAAPWVANGMYVLGVNPLPNLDLTPFAFLLSGAAISFGLLRLRFLDVVPIARGALVEGMNDGVIVADEAGRVVDLNPAARRVLRLSDAAGAAVGDPLSRLEPALGALLKEGVSGEVRLGDARTSAAPASASPRWRA